MRIYFGGYTLDADRHELRKGEEIVHLSPKGLRLLQLLATRYPNAVSKGEIFETVWPDTFVTEANLPIVVKEIRSALGDDARNPRLVRTVFGFGYALDGEVRVEQDASRAVYNSIAVLPLQNLAGGDWADVSEGLTEHLINALARSRRFKVVPRSTVFRYAEVDSDASRIGKKLGVDCLVVGRIRSRGDDLVAQIEMIDVASESQMWGQRFQRRITEVLQLQNEIAAEILSRLQHEVGSRLEEASTIPTDSAEAYRAYLRGRHQWNRRTAESFQHAIESFESATDLDARF
ncbi:MAG TPA: winged helix-turn-helix domain-containing protein, partial [Thermoanaerobaculia bacterium]